MKKLLPILLACTTLLFAALFFAQKADVSATRDTLARTVFYAFRTLDERVRYAVSVGELNEKDSEECVQALTTLNTAYVCGRTLDGRSTGLDNFEDLALALGCRFHAKNNGVPMVAIRYDGVTSENELEFLTRLAEDMGMVLAKLIAEDGLNPAYDLTWDDCMDAITPFLETWGEWTNPAPFDLLVTEIPVE